MIRVKVSRIKTEAQDIKSFELIPLDAPALPRFTAGSHIDVSLPNGFVRQYSLCSSPEETHRYLIAVLLESGSSGGSTTLHDQVEESAELDISNPRNHFKLREAARKSWLFAGGIGITPILAMAERLHSLGTDFELHYCGRSLERMAFRDYLGNTPYADRVHIHADDQPDEQKLKTAHVLSQPRPDNHLYVCGPSGFMEHIISTAEAQYWQKDRIHREYFKVSTDTSESGEVFRVRLNSSGQEVEIAVGQSVTEALAEVGVDIPVSCEQGVCGTCLTRVLDGEIDHRDMFLSEEEQERGDRFTPCCSRGRGVVVIDL